MRTATLAALAAGVLALGGGALGGCTAKPAAPPTSAVDRSPADTGPSCLTAAASPGAPARPAPAPAEAAGGAPGRGEALPALTLPCLVGGHRERLADFRGPAVINLWASWCQPCLQELPAIEAYAQHAAGTVRVVGVVTDDPDRSAAQSFVEEL